MQIPSLPSVSTVVAAVKKVPTSVIIGLVAFVAGYGAAKYSGQSTTTKTTTETTQTNQSANKTDQEVAVDTNTDKKTTDTRQTHTIITKRPDGTVTTEIYDLDKGTTYVDSTKKSTKDTQSAASSTSTSTQKTTTTTVTNSQPKWHAGAMAGVDVRSALTGKVPVVYGGSVDYRLLGPVSIGGFGLTNGTVGIEIGLGF